MDIQLQMKNQESTGSLFIDSLTEVNISKTFALSMFPAFR
jgi:hypothetical protein